MESLGETALRPSERGASRVAAASIFLTALVAAGCGGHSNPPRPDADAAAVTDARDAGADNRDVRIDSPSNDSACGVATEAGAKKAAGAACGCDGDCTSGFCVDGVCCSTACNEACKTCSATGSAGTCTFRVAGAKPRETTACAEAPASTCGFDGACDGAGACRRHVAGTICKAGTCDGDAVVGAFACDGAGRCRPGPTTICAPYSCDPKKGACYESCTQSSQCVPGQQCVASSCGKKMKGATCATNAECASGFCADKVCCNVACQGGCVSCGMPGRMGTCWPIDQGVPDPRAVCKDQGAASCGSNGTCDGFGGCERYAAETQCIPPSCTGIRRNTPGTCDGSGTCRPQKVTSCGPFLCVAGACTQSCKTDADCEAGHACVAGQCGKKNLGQPCANKDECVSGQCVEGVCCDGACSGGCKSCALPSAMGRCTPLAVGAVDTKGVCNDQGATTCGTNGRCDGSGNCQKYKEGTVCAPESCSGNVYTPASTCSATGQCTPPDQLPCAPYVCNGNTCFQACTKDGDCVTGNVCNGNSCGKKMRGASCSDAKECGSSFCAQGVCCDTACNGTCVSCALGSSRGTCMPVPGGTVDQGGACTDQGTGTCGANGKCDGAGACQKYSQGTMCKDSTCPGGTTVFTPVSSCDGTGTCVTPPDKPCFPFQCGTGVCKATCASNADCAPPAVCTNGSCGLKGRGITCADAAECASGFCAQGICCDTACNGLCTSCALPNALGTCSNVPDGGKDPISRCLDQGAASCATDGACDGLGSCRLYDAGTICMAATCPASSSTWTLARSCDGMGTCKPATTQACSPYLCNGVSACKAACTVDADCVMPNICDQQTNLCGNKRRLGQTCTATADCLTGNYCVDGVCCASSSCGLCQTCATGTCADVGSGKVEPHGGCAASPPCGNTGSCNGAGACEQASASVSCGAASCTGSTYTPVSHCTGTGSCATPTNSGCSPYVCGSGVCLVNCATDTDCVAPFTCQGSGSSRSCALKANGMTCMSGTQCISGSCVDGVCCGSMTCPSCQACNVAGSLGACAPVAAGTNAPPAFCTDQGTASCGTTGKCDGSGGCQKYANGTMCAPPVCTAGNASLTTMGQCSGGSCQTGTQSCNGHLCAGGASCPTTCNADTDCVTATHYCTGVGGTCQPKIAQGSMCGSNHECGTGKCVDGVCCGSAACGSCQACNVGGSLGTCAPLAAGAPDPKAICTDNLPASCGTNGKCDGNGGCQKYANGTMCAPPVCTVGNSSLTTTGLCSSGSCQTGTQSCNGHLCTGGTSCPTTCNADTDCVTATHYCTGAGGTCQPKIAQGSMCSSNHECGTGKCVDGVCCGSAACGSCQRCNVGGSVGTCAPVSAGTLDPKMICTDQGTASCGTNGRCDGNGGCQKYADATACSVAVCQGGGSSILTQAGGCSAGSCAAGTKDCAPYACNVNACRTMCAGDGDCASGHYCAAMPLGTCKAQGALGDMCTGDNQCGSGHCTDGVCCDSSACAPCKACNLGGVNPGTCKPLTAGTMAPVTFCTDQGTASCGTNGKCDGNGGCQKYANGTMCSSAVCTTGNSSLTTMGQCSGGSCQTGTQTCNGHLCTGGASCPTTCNADTDCVMATHYCPAPGGTCTAKLAQGDVCTTNHQCGTGKCTDGVCCDATACDPCKACNLGGGTCKPVTAGTPAPPAFCSDQGATSCGTTGNCDGNGGCQKYADGTMCHSQSCAANSSTQVNDATCAGGACTPTTTPCGAYKCDGATSCRGTCDVDANCATTDYYCTGLGGSCVLKGEVGDTCAYNGQCKNDQCVDGVCCGVSSCANNCYTCADSMHKGSCWPRPAGPAIYCVADTPESCGQTGACDGSGHCAKWDATTVCMPGTCDSLLNEATAPAKCDGSGICQTPPPPASCLTYSCNAAGTACNADCATNGNADCSAGNACQPGNVCGP